MPPDWKKFERVVAAIQAMQESGAIVTWNEGINGRQFDVTVRFKKAIYDFLVVIECKDYATAVPAEKLDALVTKARDAHADKAVMVAANGFQSGAKEVAERHNVTILSLSSINKNEKELADSIKPVLYLSFLRCEADSLSPGTIVFPDDPRRARSVMRHTQIIGPNLNETLESFLNRYNLEIQRVTTSETQTFRISLPNETVITHPNFPDYLTPVKTVLIDHVFIPEAELVNLEYVTDDPTLSSDILTIRDEISGESKIIDVTALQHGFDTKIEQGCFYINPNLNNSYFVESIDGDLVTYYLVESYLYGELFQAKYDQHIQYSTQFVKITDEMEIGRLRSLLDALKEE